MKLGDHMMLHVSCENPDVQYIDLPDIRLIFHEGEYVGYYKP